MLNGNISNIPAPTAYFDGATFVYKHFLSYKAIPGWADILRNFYREYTVYLWFDPGWFRIREIGRGHRCFKGLWFNGIVIESIRDISWRLHKTRSRIISGRESFIRQCPHAVISIASPMERLRGAV